MGSSASQPMVLDRGWREASRDERLPSQKSSEDNSLNGFDEAPSTRFQNLSWADQATNSPAMANKSKITSKLTKDSDLEWDTSDEDADERAEPDVEQETNTEGTKKKAAKTKLTEKEIAKRKKQFLNKYEKDMVSLSAISSKQLKRSESPFTEEFLKCLKVLRKSFYSFDEYEVPSTVIADYRREIGHAMVKRGAIKVFCDVLSYGLKRGDYVISTQDPVTNELWFYEQVVLKTLWCYTDCCDEVKVSLMGHPEALQLIVKTLMDGEKGHLSKQLSKHQDHMLQSCLSILHNCASMEENVQRLRDIGTIQAVLPYLDSHDDNIRLTSIADLADLVNEEEAELLGNHISIFQFLLTRLDQAMKTDNHRDSWQWSVQELTRAVRRLARNDANKEILVMEGCLPLLVELLKTGNDGEETEALGSLWALSFDVGNKQKMVEEPALIQTIWDKYKASSGPKANSCYGILWSLREELMGCVEYIEIGYEVASLQSNEKFKEKKIEEFAINYGGAKSMPFGRKKKAKPRPSKQQSPVTVEKSKSFDVQGRGQGGKTLPPGHVMISYQWAHQDVIKRICAELRKHDVPVWIDIDYMEGSVLQAMARAVEDSCAVIMAMSQRYKDSPNTRAEAEYAFQLRKNIIPLVMQEGYKADGWLGIILGSKLFYDFSGKYSFESRMKMLQKAVKAARRGEELDMGQQIQPVVTSTSVTMTTTPPKPSLPTEPSQPSQQTDQVDVKNWTKAQVMKWLEKNSLQHHSSLTNLTGKKVLFLHNVKHEAPEFFYNYMKTEMCLTSLTDLANATDALDNLTL